MQDILFTIITTTYKRPEFLERAVKSVFGQTTPNWKLVVVNDSPEWDYAEFEKKYIHTDVRITYIRNVANKGKNFSVNKALEQLYKEKFDGYILFLDDDDWLVSDCLKQFTKEIQRNTNSSWFVSKRSSVDGSDFVYNKTGKNIISYLYDMLLRRRFYGDTTQCIYFPLVSKYRFSDLVKNGEEWLYYSQVAQRSPTFLYIDVTGTYSDGYQENGLTKKGRTFKDSLYLWQLLCVEINRKKLWGFSVLLYMLLRLVKMFFVHFKNAIRA